MHRRIIAPGALAAASLMLAIPASAASYSPGAPGIGDPYYPFYGNGGYDVSHYDLRLQYQPATDELAGTATILAKTTQDLSRFNLDFLLDVSEIRVNGAKATFATSGQHELEITPKTPLPKGTPITVVVRYSGVPSTKSAYGFTTWHRTPDGAVAADEPESAWWWFPSNDHPSDKATYDVSVAVPNGTQAISNGTLQSTSSQLGWTRYNWRENKPQATYLATLALGKFDITTSTSDGGVPVINAYSKDLGDNDGSARASVERTGEIVDWLSGYFGPYPFSSAAWVCAQHDHRVRAGDPDARLLQPEAVRERRQHLCRRARVGPPVVRRRRVPEGLEGHLDQRGLRAVRAVALVRARGRGDGAATRRLRVCLASGRRCVLDDRAG